MDGLFDIQVNGFAGVDFQAPELSPADLRRAVDGLRRHGTAGIFLTLVTNDVHWLARRFAAVEAICAEDEEVASMVKGYHLEGPWLSREEGYRGAHQAKFMGPPDWDDFQRIQEAANGRIRFLTVAPEWPGSSDFIAKVTASGVEVGLGHTAASSDDIQAAIDHGVRFCTHLGNAVPRELDRHDNVVQRLLARDELYAFFIPDGIHLPPFVLQNFVRAKPAGKALFTTDCMAAAGAPPGRYALGHLELEVGTDRVVRAPGHRGFAGSALAPDEGVVKLREMLGYDEDSARSAFGSEIARLFKVSL